MDSSDDKIVIENVNVPGSATRVSKAMYDAMQQAMWKVLPATAPGLTQSEIRGSVVPYLPEDLYPGERAFRLDHIDGLDLLRKTFKPRPSEQAPNKLIEVRIRFAPEVVRWVRERQHYAFQAEEPAPDGGAVMVYRLGTLQEIKPWLLSWGAAAEPLAPAHLRDEIRQELLKLVEKLT